MPFVLLVVSLRLCFRTDLHALVPAIVKPGRTFWQNIEAYEMMVNAENITFMTNTTKGVTWNIQVSAQILGTINEFNNFGAIVTDEWFKSEILAWLHDRRSTHKGKANVEGPEH